MILEPHVLYINGKPRAITWAKDPEHALESYRLAALGQKRDEKEIVTAVIGWDAPAEDVMRVCLLGIYSRMFQADMAAMAAGRQRQ
jgi:hypothetical protein